MYKVAPTSSLRNETKRRDGQPRAKADVRQAFRAILCAENGFTCDYRNTVPLHAEPLLQDQRGGMGEARWVGGGRGFCAANKHGLG